LPSSKLTMQKKAEADHPANDDDTDKELIERLASRLRRCNLKAGGSKEARVKGKAEADLPDADLRLFNQLAWRLDVKDAIMEAEKKGRITASGEYEEDAWEEDEEEGDEEDE